MEEENKTIDVNEELKKQIEEEKNKIFEEKINVENIKYLSLLLDGEKDIETIKNIKEGINMNYGREYGYGDSYGRKGVAGTGRRYSAGGNYRYGDNYQDGSNYGARGYDAKYRGEEALDEMAYHYGNYQTSGSYGAKEDSAYKMTEALKKFIYATSEELQPNEKMMFKQALQEVTQNMEM